MCLGVLPPAVKHFFYLFFRKMRKGVLQGCGAEKIQGRRAGAVFLPGPESGKGGKRGEVPRAWGRAALPPLCEGPDAPRSRGERDCRAGRRENAGKAEERGAERRQAGRKGSRGTGRGMLPGRGLRVRRLRRRPAGRRLCTGSVFPGAAWKFSLINFIYVCKLMPPHGNTSEEPCLIPLKNSAGAEYVWRTMR